MYTTENAFKYLVSPTKSVLHLSMRYNRKKFQESITFFLRDILVKLKKHQLWSQTDPGSSFISAGY